MNSDTPHANPQAVSHRDVLDLLDELNHVTPPQQHTPPRAVLLLHRADRAAGPAVSALCAHRLPGSCKACFFGPAKPVVHRDPVEVKAYWERVSGVDLAGRLIPGLTPSERANVDRWAARREASR